MIGSSGLPSLLRPIQGASLLNFYRELAHLQKQVFDDVRSRGETDVRALARHFPSLIELVRRSGPEPLADFSSKLTEELLADYWQGIGEYDPAGRSSVAAAVCRVFGLARRGRRRQALAAVLDVRNRMATLQPSSTTCEWMLAIAARLILRRSISLRTATPVPVVDEIATVALNIWAEEHGYSKLEPNLLGM